MNETALIAPTIKGRTIKTMEKKGFWQKVVTDHDASDDDAKYL